MRETSTARGTETILVVEDQEQLRKIVVRVLRGHGYEALEAQIRGTRWRCRKATPVRFTCC